jgi:cell wall-associated NlpC family hydrolase
VTELGLAFAVAAEGFIGAPFRFRGRDPRTGIDCVGLVAAALEALGERAPSVPTYAMRQRDFAAQLDSAADAGFAEVTGDPRAGDLLLLRPGPAQVHLAVVGAGGGLVHAHAGLGKVVLTPPPAPWPIERHWRLRRE